MVSSRLHTILPRERITETLVAGIAAVPLVVLTAPMGYGKTTAARELAKKLPNHRVFHVKINPGLHNATYFWDNACCQLQEQGSEIAPSLRRAGFPEETLQMQRTLEQIKKHLAGRPTLLIIDDYHFVASLEIDALIETVARERFPNLSILLLSRSRPSLPMEDLRIKRRALLFDQDLLTFSDDETAQYFSLHGISDRNAVRQAHDFSEGWAAALWLSLNSFLTSGALIPVHDVEKLLATTIFERYPDEDKALLMKVSVVDSVTPEQATAITNTPAAPSQLARLREQNAFLHYDPATRRYRLHSIFRDFLQNRRTASDLPAASSIDSLALYRKTGEWFATEGETAEAVHFLAQAGTDVDLLRILQIFEVPNDGLSIMFDPGQMAHIFKSIPWSIRCQCPLGYLSFVYHYISRVDFTEGLRLLNEAAAYFEETPLLSSSLRERLRGEIELIRGIEAFNDFSAMRDRHKAAHALLARTAQGRSSISHRKLIWTFGSPHVTFLYLRDPGTFEKLVRSVQGDLLPYQELTDGCSAGAQDLTQAEYFLETGILNKVEICARKADYRAREKEQLSSIIAVNFTLARLALAEGQGEKALALIQELAPQVEAANHPLLNLSLDLCTAYVAAILQRSDLIPLWLHEGDLTRCNFYQSIGFAQVVHGRALLVMENWPCLEALSQDIPARLGRHRNLLARIHAYMLQAVAAYHLNGIIDAITALNQAIELARPDRIVITIAEYGKHVLPLLQRLQRQLPQDTFITSLIRRARIYEYSGTATPQGLKGLLTVREQNILELAAQGKSNVAIAEILGLKPITISKALSRIYQKLGVKNRAEAVTSGAITVPAMMPYPSRFSISEQNRSSEPH